MLPGFDNLVSKLTGVVRSVGKALRFNRIYTYTMTNETGISIKASGFKIDKENCGSGPQGWNMKNRPRETPKHLCCPKNRWVIEI